MLLKKLPLFHVVTLLRRCCSTTTLSASLPADKPAQQLVNLMRIAELVKETQPKEDVTIQGWIRCYTRHRKVIFLKLNDGLSAHQIQAVVPRSVCRTCSPGNAIQLHGQWVASIGPEQSMEFLADRCTFVGKNDVEQLPAGDADNLRQMPHLRAKALKFAALLRLRSELTHLTHRFFKDAQFVHVDTPLLSENDCEGAGEAFGVTCPDGFFGESSAFLPVSGQLHLEALCSALNRVYTLSPAFRANPSSTRQHLAEFRMLEAEWAFADSLDTLCDFVEQFLHFLVDKVGQNASLADDFVASEPICQRSGQSFDVQILSKCMPNRLPRLAFVDAIRLVGRQPDELHRPLNKQEEMHLVEQFKGPLFVTHFPSSQKPFYMRRTEDGQFTESFDLLAPFVGELAGGSVREWDAELLAQRLPAGQANDKLDWYVDLRRRGYPRSAGFGLGMDRLMQSLFGIVNVKDTIPFPRWANQALKC